jgi:peptidoglycan/LPS O-acetylase OafA/YrhL
VALKYEWALKMVNRFKVLLYFSILNIVLFPYLLKLSLKYQLHLGWILIPFVGSIGTLTSISISIIMLYSVNHSTNIWYKFLNLKIMEQIGILSYSIYLWQQIFISDLPFVKRFFPLNLLLLVIVSVFSYYIIEKPFLKLKDRFSKTNTIKNPSPIVD